MGGIEGRSGVARFGPTAAALATAIIASLPAVAATDTPVPSPALAPVRAQEVRTVWTAEFGLPHPESVTYDDARGELVVRGRDGADTVVLRLGFDENLIASTRIPSSGSDSGAGRAVTTHAGLRYELDGTGRRLTGADAGGEVQLVFDLSDVPLLAPAGIAFAPSSDPTDDPGAVNLFVADAGTSRLSGGITEISLAAVTAAVATLVTPTVIRTVLTSTWSPGAPDPSGVVYVTTGDQLFVVDSEVDEVTGAGWHDVNLWRRTRQGGAIGVGTFWGPNSGLFAGKRGFSREPTGAGFDSVRQTLLVSDDSAQKIFLVGAGPDGQYGTTDDTVGAIDAAALGSTDTEDPEFDPVTGDIFFLDGTGREIHRVSPVDGIFGNGNDQTSHFDISHLGPTDFEGLTLDAARGTLYVGARTTKQIFEITKTGALVRTINATGVSGLRFISGLGTAPASDGSGVTSIWIVDRAVDNGSDSNENDGKMFELVIPGDGPVNQPPVANADTATTSEDTAVAVAVLANDTDPDGNPMTVQLVTQPANGSAVVNTNQTVTFTPAANFNGSTSFTYRASDGQATSNLATVSVSVTGVNDPPVAAGDSANTPRDTAATIAVLANDTDVDGDTLAVQLATQPANGSAVVNADQTVTFTPSDGFTGTTSFTYRASDGQATSNLATVSITVTGVNDPPAAADDSATTGEDTPVTIAVLANDTDPNGNSLTVQLATQPANGTAVVNANQTVTFTPAADFNGSTSYTYRASDGQATSNLATVSITVTPVNDAPVAGADGATTAEDTPVTISVLANDTDVDGDTLTARLITQPANGTAAVNADQTVTFTPAADFNGSTSFTYRASDGQATSNLATVSITVIPVNDAPVATADTATTTRDTATTVDVLANDTDVDGNTLTVTALTSPTNGTVSVVAGGVLYTPNPGFIGGDSFTYRASDGVVTSAPATVTVTVTDPVTTISRAISQVTVRGSVVSGALTSTYADDDDRLVLREEAYAGGKKTRLEHRWTFQVTPGTAVTLTVRAHTTGEPFDLAYSTDNGSTWLPVGQVTALGETLTTVSLPSSLSGTVLVRADDAVSAGRGDTFADSLSVDELVIRSIS